MSLSALLEESFEIARNYLEATGDIANRDIASRFLADTIELMIRSGQRSRLVLSNKAIDAYKKRFARERVLPMVS
jgi:hypothetical protein